MRSLARLISYLLTTQSGRTANAGGPNHLTTNKQYRLRKTKITNSLSSQVGTVSFSRMNLPSCHKTGLFSTIKFQISYRRNRAEEPSNFMMKLWVTKKQAEMEIIQELQIHITKILFKLKLIIKILIHNRWINKRGIFRTIRKRRIKALNSTHKMTINRWGRVSTCIKTSHRIASSLTLILAHQASRQQRKTKICHKETKTKTEPCKEIHPGKFNLTRISKTSLFLNGRSLLNHKFNRTQPKNQTNKNHHLMTQTLKQFRKKTRRMMMMMTTIRRTRCNHNPWENQFQEPQLTDLVKYTQIIVKGRRTTQLKIPKRILCK